MLQVAAYTPGKENRPAYAEALEFQRENCPHPSTPGKPQFGYADRALHYESSNPHMRLPERIMIECQTSSAVRQTPPLPLIIAVPMHRPSRRGRDDWCREHCSIQTCTRNRCLLPRWLDGA
jgi:hypothetical protein